MYRRALWDPERAGEVYRELIACSDIVIAGHGPDDRLRTAARTGAFACLSPGDGEGLPYADELHKLEACEGVIR
jgi:hypothetical protein